MGTVPAIPAVADSTVFGKTYGPTLTGLRMGMKNSKTPTTLKNAPFVVDAKCWAVILVGMNFADIRAVGVVAPGAPVSSKTAARSRAAEGMLGCWFVPLVVVAVITVLAMAGGSSAGGGVAALLVIGGITALLVQRRRQDRDALKASALISKPAPAFDLMLHGMNRLGQITCAFDDFDAKMKKSAKEAHLEPLTLPESLRTAPEGIHITLWEVANHDAQIDTEALTAGIEALTKVVFDTIETTWATFEGFTVPIPEAPTPLIVEAAQEPPAVDAVLLLKEITEQIETDRTAAEQTNQEIARINRPETGLGS